jgi:hypothetical protein
MFKTKRPHFNLFMHTLRMLLARVFFVFRLSGALTPVIFYTRVRMRYTRLRNRAEAGDASALVIAVVAAEIQLTAVVRVLLVNRGVFYTRVCTRIRAYAGASSRGAALKRWGTVALLGTLVLSGLVSGLLKPEVAHAATADTVNFQAKLESNDGAIVGDGYYNVQFKLYNVSTGGAALWTEDDVYVDATHDYRPRLVNGYLSVNLGAVNAFPTINWDQDLYVTMNIGGSGTTPSYDGEMNPRLKLTAVPYAFSAGQLSKAVGTASTKLDFVTPTGTNNNTILLPDASGYVCLDISVNNCNFASGSGSGAYIQNGTAPQNTANFNIQSAATGSPTIQVRQLAAQTASLLEFQDPTGTSVLSGFDKNGNLFYHNAFTGTLVQDTLTQDTSYHLPATGYSSETICTISTCTGGAGGSLSSTGTAGHIARFNSATALENSQLYDNNTFIGLGTTTDLGKLSIVTSSTTRPGLYVETGVSSATADTVVLKTGTGQTGKALRVLDAAGTGTLATIEPDGSITSANSISANGNLSAGGTLTVSSSATIGGTLGVSGTGTFQSGVSVLGAGGLSLGNSATNTAGVINFANSSNSFLTTVTTLAGQDQTLTLPDSQHPTDTICLYTLANCAGAGAGITGAGTINYIARFDTSGAHIGNSLLYDDTNFVGLNTSTNAGLLSVVGKSATQSSLFAQGFTSSTVPVAIIRGGATPSTGGDLLQLQTAAGTPVAAFDAAGNFTTTGTYSQTGAATFSTGTGVVSLNGDTTIASGKTLSVGQAIFGQSGSFNGQLDFKNTFNGNTATIVAGNTVVTYSLILPTQAGIPGECLLYTTGGQLEFGDCANGTGTAFLQGGNDFGGTTAGDIGTKNNGVLNFKTNNIDKLTLDTSGNLYFLQSSNIGAVANPTTNAAGYNINLAAGTANGSTTGNNGGVLSLNGGAAAGTGNNSGGNVTIDGGTKTGTGTRGNVILQGNGGNVGIGTSGTPSQLFSVGGTTGNLTVDTSGNLVTSGNLSVTGTSTFTGLITASGGISVANNSNLTFAAGTGNFDQSASSGSFATGTGIVNLNGDVTVASNKNFTFATGTGSFDQSASTGVFKTGTGAVSLNGNTAITGAGSFTSGTGAVQLNGNTAITGTNTLTVGSGATALGGTLGVTGLTSLNGGATITGTTDIEGTTTINTTSTANTSIGNATGTFSLTSSTLNISAGALSGVTGFTQTSGNFDVSASGGTFLTSSGAVSLNGNTTVASGKTLTLTTLGTATNNTALCYNGSGQVASCSNPFAIAPATGGYIYQVPTTTAANTIAPTTNGVVALTVKGTTGTTARVLEVYDSTATPTLQAFFDATGSLNVSQVIQPTSGNTVDLGTTGSRFRTGYFGTSVDVGGSTLTSTSLNFTAAGTIQSASNSNLDIRSQGTGALTLQSGSGTVSLGTSTNLTANAALTITSGGANALNLDTGAAGTATVSIGTTNATAVSIGRTGQTTTVNGALTAAQLLTGQLGLTVTGAAVSLNDSSNFGTSINGGSSTGAVTIGNAGANTSNTVSLFSGADSIVLNNTNTTVNGAISLNGTTTLTAGNSLIYATGNGNFDQSASTGTFKTGTGAVSLNGDTSVATGKSLTFIGGASNFDQSASTGTFKTGTGAVSLNGDTTVATGKNLTVTAGSTSLTGSAAGSSTATTINTGAATNVGVIIQGATTQSSDLFRLQDNAGNVNASFSSTGNKLTLGRIAATGTATQGQLVFGDGTTDNFGITLVAGLLGNNYTATLPAPTTGTTPVICYRNDTACGFASAIGAGYVYFAPGTAQVDASTNSTIFLNKTGASGNILQLQSNGTDALVLSNTGVLTLSNGLNVTGATNINTTGSAATTIGNSGAALSITGTGATAATNIVSLRVAADAADRFTIGADGKLSFGAGATATDTTLYRNGANSLRTGGALTVDGSSTLSGTLSVAGLATFNGGISVASNTGITFAAGTGSFDQSASTGTFKTGTGAVTLNGSTVITNGNLASGGTNTDLTLSAAGTGVINLNDSVKVATLGAASGGTNAYLCRDTSSTLLTSCNTTGTGAAFVQGGNTFGAAGDLGTNDNFALNFRTNGTTKLSVDTTGNLTFAQASILSTGANTLTITSTNFNVTSAGALSAVGVNSGTGLLQGTGGATINGTIRLGATSAATNSSNIFIADTSDATGTQTVSIGSNANTASSTTIRGGDTGGVSIGASGSTPVTIGSTGGGTTTLQSAGGVKLTTVGSVTANSATLCRDTSTTVLTSCDATNTTGRPFLQGGNSFGAAGDLGTNDNFALNFRTNGTTKLTVSTAGDLQFAQGASRTLNVGANTTANGAGYNFSVAAGAADGTGAGNNGGTLNLQGGAAAGTGNNNGGAVTILGGNPTGTGGRGIVNINNGSGGAVNIGGSGLTTLNGTLVQVGNASGNNVNFNITGADSATNTSTVSFNNGRAVVGYDGTANAATLNGFTGKGVNLVVNGVTTGLSISSANATNISGTLSVTGLATVNGSLSVANNSNITFASGTGNFDQSASTGTFKTGTGAVNLNGSTVITNGNLASGGTNTDLTISAAGTGVINLNDSVKVATLGAASGATNAYLCRDTSSTLLTTCNTTGTGAAFVQGGNSFGAAADLGTNDNFALNFRTNGTTKLSVTTAGDLQFAQGANRTLNVASNATANGAGYNFTVAAGAADGTGTGNVGGALALQGGAAAGTGNNNGGSVTLDGGAATGTGTVGRLILQGTSGQVAIGSVSNQSSGEILSASNSTNSFTGIGVHNANAGTNASAGFIAYKDNNGNTANSGYFGVGGTNYSTVPILGNKAFVYAGSGVGGAVIDTGAATPIVFGINNAEAARFSGTGNLLLGNTAGTALLSVGSTAQFTVDSSGNLIVGGTSTHTGLATFNGGLNAKGAINLNVNAAEGNTSIGNTSNTFQVASSALNITGTGAISGVTTLSASGAVTLGATGTSTGTIVFKGATAASGAITLLGPINPGTFNLTLPNENGTLCSTGSICAGYQAAPATGSYVKTNPVTSADNTVLAPATAGVVALTLKGNSTANAHVFDIYDSAATPALQDYFDANGSLNVGKLIQPTTNNSTDLGTSSARFRTGYFGTSIDVGGSTFNSTDLSFSGAGNVTSATNTNLVVKSQGTGSLTLQSGNGTVTLGTSTNLTASAALTIQSGGANTLAIDTGASGATVSVGATNATAVSIGRTGQATTVNGALNVSQTSTFSALLQPNANNTIDLGTSSARFRTEYLGTSLDVAGTTLTSAQLQFVTGGARTINIAQETGTTTGDTLTIAAGQGGSGNATGGVLALQGGAGAGTNQNGGSLTIDGGAATGAATKGTVAIQSNGGQVSIGNVSSQQAGETLGIAASSNGSRFVGIHNSNSGAAALSGFSAFNDNTGGSTSNAFFGVGGTSYGTALFQNRAFAIAGSTTVGFTIGNVGTNPTVFINNSAEIARFSSAGNLLLGNTSGTSLLSVGSAAQFTVDTSGNTTVGGTLGVTGLATLNGGVTVKGTANINTTAADGNTSIGNTSNTFQVASSALNITAGGAINGVTTLSASGAVTLGTTGTSTGTIIFKGSTAASGAITLLGPINPGTFSLTLPNESGTICSTGSICAGYQAAPATGSYVKTNPVASSDNTINAPATAGVVALTVKGNQTANAHVLDIYNSASTPTLQDYFDANGSLNVGQIIQPTTSNSIDLGTASARFRTGYFGTSIDVGGSTFSSTDLSFTGAGNVTSATNTNLVVKSQGTGSLTLQSGSGTVTLGTSTNLTAGAALTIQSGGANNITVDTGSGATVNVGTTNANAVSIGRTSQATTVNGALNITQTSTFSSLLQPNANNTIDLGTAAARFRTAYLGTSLNVGGSTLTSTNLDFTGAGAITSATNTNLNISSQGTGALTLQSGSGTVTLGTSTALTASAALTLKSGGATALTLDTGAAGTAAINIGNATATSVSIGRSGQTTTVNGGLTATQLLTGNLGATISGAAISLNDSSNFATTINGGTSTGAVTIGNAAAGSTNTVTLQSSGNSVVLNNTQATINGTLSVNATTTFTAGKDLIFAGGASNFDQSLSTGFFKTGTGAVSLNGDTTITGTKFLSVGGAATVTGLTTLNGGLTAKGAVNINTNPVEGNTSIGNTSNTFQVASSALNIGASGNINGVTTLSASGTVTLGVTGTSTGRIDFKGSTAASGAITLLGPANPGTFTLTLPNESGTICSTGSICAGYAASVAGSTGSGYIKQVPTVTADNTIIPTAASIVALTVKGTNNATTANVLEVFNSGTTQTRQAYFDANGTLNVANAIQPTSTNAVDVGTSSLRFKTGYFGTSVNVSGTVLDNANLDFTGTGSVTSASGNLLTLQSGSGTISLGTTTNVSAGGALTIKSGGTSNLTLDTTGTAATLNLGTASAAAVSIGRSGQTTTVNGALTSTQLLTGNLGLSVNGGTANINDNSAGNQATNINTTSGTGAVSIGNSSTTSLTLEGGTGASAIAIGNGNTAHGIKIGTGTGTQTIVIGSGSGTSLTTIQGANGVNINSGASAGAVNIGSATSGAFQLQSANASTINTGSATLGITSANFTVAAATGNVTAGTYNGLTLATAADGFTVAGGTTSRTLTVTGAAITIGNNILPTAAGALSVASNGANTLSLDTGTVGAGSAQINIGTSQATSISIGRTGKTTTNNGAFTVTQLLTGNGGLTITGGDANINNNSATNSDTNINTGTGTGSVTIGSTTTTALVIDAGTGASSITIGNSASAHGIKIGTGAGVETISIGSTNTTSTTLISGGTGNAAGSEAIRLTPTTTGGIAIGNSGAATGTVTLGQSTATNTINLGSAAGLTGTQTINLGTSTAGTTNINIGNTAAGTVTVKSDITIQTAAAFTLGGRSNGVLQIAGGAGLVTSGALNLAGGASYISGTLPVGNGGTGATTFATNGILYGNAGSAINVTAAANNSVLITSGAGVPSLSTTLPTAVQDNITRVDTTTGLVSGAIGSGFGNIQTGNRIATSRNGTGTNDSSIAATGTTVADAGSSLLRLGNSISGGNAVTNGGTYFGINAPGSGAGTAADFLNFQTAGTVKLFVTSAGQINATGGYAVGANIGSTITCPAGQVLVAGVYTGGITTGGACSSPAGAFAALQDAYNNSGSTNPQILLNSAYGGLKIDDGTTPVTGPLLRISNNGHTVDYLAVTALGVTTTGKLTVNSTPAATASDSLVQFGTTPISGGSASGTYVGINQGAGTADFVNLQVTAGSVFKIAASGAVTSLSSVSANSLAATTTVSAGSTVNATTAYLLNGSVGTNGTYLRSDGSTGYVASALQAVDGTGKFILNNPVASSDNTITAPATAGVVALTVKGNATANTDVLAIYDSAATPAKQAFFDNLGALNVSQAIRPTANNTIDLGLTGTRFRTGYFGTSVDVGGTVYTSTNVDFVGAGTIRSAAGTNLNLDSAGAGTAIIQIGTTNATSVSIGRTGQTATANGAFTVSQLLTGNLGLTISGAAASINDNSNFNTTINTGSSTGSVTIGSVTAASGTQAINIGANTTTGSTTNTTVGSTTTGSSTIVQGGATNGIALNASTITTNASTVALFNATPTTVNAFGAASSVNIGAAAGTVTFGNTGTSTLQGVNNQNITLRGQGTGSLTLTSGAASTYSTTVGALTVQGFGGTNIFTPSATGASSAITIATGTTTTAGTTGSVLLTSGNSTTSGNSGAVALTSGNAASGTAGNISLDVGTSSTGNGTIFIGNASRAQTVTIGNSTGATGVTLIAGTGNIALNTAAVTTTSGTIALFNGTPTTVNAFGAATTITQGAATGTTTFGNGGAYTLQSTTGQLTVQSGSGNLSLGSTTTLSATGALTIAPAGTLTLGSAAQTLSLLGGAATSLVVGTGGNTTTVNFTAPSGANTITFPAASGTVQLSPSGSGNSIVQVPSSNTDGTNGANTIKPTASGIVGLTIKGTTTANANTLQIFDSAASQAMQAFFEAAGNFNVSKTIKATATTADIGQSGATFGSAYFAAAGTVNVGTSAFGANSLTFANGANSTINPLQTTGTTVGRTLTIAGGQGGSGNAAGGVLALQGGAGAGTNQNGGNLTIDGGAATGTGTKGTVVLQGTGGGVVIGAATTTRKFEVAGNSFFQQTADTTTVTIQAFTGQTANLVSFKNEAGITKSFIDPFGNGSFVTQAIGQNPVNNVALAVKPYGDAVSGLLINPFSGSQTAPLVEVDSAAGSATPYFYVKANGNVAVGNSAATQQFSVGSTGQFNVTSTGAATAVGVTSAGAAISLNDSSNFNTSINGGTSTGTVSIGAGTGAGSVSIGNSAAAGYSFTTESGTGTTSLFNGATAHTIALATGAATQAITIGSTNGSSALTLQSSTNIVANATGVQFSGGGARTVSVASATSGASLTIAAGTSTTANNNGGTLFLQAGAGAGTGTTGSVVVKANASESATAFQIQNNTGTGLLTFSTVATAPILSIGSAASVTAITATSAGNLAVGGSTALNGQVVIGTATDNVTIDLANHRLSYLGTARQNTTQLLSPEFPGATLSGDGSQNIGTMTSDFCGNTGTLTLNTGICNTGQVHNYYSWTTSQSAQEDYDIYARWQVPSNFGDTAAFSFSGWRTAVGTNESITVTLYNSAGTSCGSGTIGGATGTVGSWVTAVNITYAGCTITAGENMTFKTTLSVPGSNTDFVRMGEITIGYNAKF